MTSFQQIANHLGITKAAASKQIKKLGIDYKSMTIDEIAKTYMARQRAIASGHLASVVDNSGKTMDALYERALKERREREVLELKLAKRQQEICRKEEVYQEFSLMAKAVKKEIHKANQRIAKYIQRQYSVKVDINLIGQITEMAIEHLNRTELLSSHQKGD